MCIYTYILYIHIRYRHVCFILYVSRNKKDHHHLGWSTRHWANMYVCIDIYLHICTYIHYTTLHYTNTTLHYITLHYIT